MKSLSILRLSFVLLFSCAVGVTIPFFFFLNQNFFTRSITSYTGSNQSPASGNNANNINTPAMEKYSPPLSAASTLNVTSEAFTNNSNIPGKYTCDGQSINPPLTIKRVPANAKSIVIIADDPDAPKGTFTHWLVWNIQPAAETKIKENSQPGVEGNNSKGKNGYTGPCPPSGTHHYHFKVSALDIKLDLKEGSDKDALEKAMVDHIIAYGEIVGLYAKAK